VTAAPGSYRIEFTASDGKSETSEQRMLTVTKEDCLLTYTGATLVDPLANAALSAKFAEPDASTGSWAGKRVVFASTNTSSQTIEASATTNTGGQASTSISLPADVYGVVANFTGDEFYNACRTAAAPNDTVVTVQAAGTKATGGGWFGQPSRTNFGFNLLPEAGGRWKGQLQLRSNNGKLLFHGSSAANASQPSPTSVKWTGTGSWNGKSGYTYEVTVVDNAGSAGRKPDSISVKVYPSGNPAAPTYTSNGSQSLKGGNITVH